MGIKRVWRVLLGSVLLLGAVQASAQERLKPFVLAYTSTDGIESVTDATRQQLIDAGFRVIGDYAPYDGAAVMVFTSDDLIAAASRTELGEFGSVLRAAVTVVDDTAQVSYVNPLYLAQAYRLDDDLAEVAGRLEQALGAEQTFGSKKGLKPKSLRKYHYMIGMEYFRDTYDLGSFDSQEAALAAVAAGLASNENGLGKVFRLDLTEQNAVLFGVSMAPDGDEDKYFNDAYQMSIVDFKELRGTPYLPYEVLVKDGQVSAMHMRFRMAVHFPDLSMMGKHSFMTLMPSPDAIEKALKTLAADSSQ